MKLNKIALLSLSVLLSLSFIALDAGETNDMLKKQLDKMEQEEIDAAKSNVASSVLGAVAIGVIGGSISQLRAIENTGFDVGLGASTVLLSLSLFMDSKKAKALQSMAVTAPVIAAMGSLLSKPGVTGPDGIFAKHLPFGLNSVVQSAANSSSTEKKAALLVLSAVGCYIAGKPYLDRFSAFMQRKSTEAYELVTSVLN